MKVSTNISLEEDGFGDYNKDVIVLLINSVKEYFAESGVTSEKQILIKHKEGEPLCCPGDDANSHIILLSSQKNYWDIWVYQFAHEYCHHLIDGGLQRGNEGLRWLEESLCHVASYVCFDRFVRKCAENPTLVCNVGWLIDNLQDNYLTEKGTRLYGLFMPDQDNPNRYVRIPKEYHVHLQSYVNVWAEKMTSEYAIDQYMYISKFLFPHFYNNKNLWKILPHLGDTRKWTSIEVLYEYLKQHKEEDFKNSLDNMMECLIKCEDK